MVKARPCKESVIPTHPSLSVRHWRGRPRDRVIYRADFMGPISFDTFVTDVTTGLRTVLERILYVKGAGGFQTPPSPLDGIYAERLAIEKVRLVEILEHLGEPTVLSAEDFLAHYSGPKLKRYTKAGETYERRGCVQRDADVAKAHLKFEKIESNNVDKGWDARVCRFIGPRSYVYNYAIGRYLIAMELEIFAAINLLYTGLRRDGANIPTVMKGLNATQCAEILRDKYERFVNPVIISLDAKRWDQHVSEQALRWEHSIYLARTKPGYERQELRRLLNWQISNNITLGTDNGSISFKKRGGRMSGDMNTSLGNCLLMCALMHSYIVDSGIKYAEVANNGDDTLVIMEEYDTVRFKNGLDKWWREMGFTLEFEGETTMLNGFKFCQAFYYNDGVSETMIRDLRPVLSKDLISIKPLPSAKLRAAYLYSVAKGGLAQHGGVPILDSFYRMLLDSAFASGFHEKQLRKHAHYFDVDRYNYNVAIKDMNRSNNKITAVGRASLFESTGISPSLQVALEATYDRTLIDVHSMTPGEFPTSSGIYW